MVYVICYNLGNKEPRSLEILASTFCEAVKIGLEKVKSKRVGNEYFNLYEVKKTKRKALLKAV